MKNKSRISRLVTLPAAIVLLYASQSAANSQLAISPWPKFHHDLRNTGQATVNGPTNGVVKWTYATVRPVRASATIGADGTIYVGNGIAPICAVNPADG